MRTIAMLAAVSLFLVGCGDTNKSEPKNKTGKTDRQVHAPADPHDVPITEADVKMPSDYNEAVERIKQYRDTIKDKIAAGKPAEAHRALDELDIVLNKLMPITEESRIPESQWRDINLAGKEIRGRFNKIHEAIDAKQAPDYSTHETEIDTAIRTLEMSKTAGQ